MFNFKQYNWKRYNLSLVAVVIVLCVSSAFFVRLAGDTDAMGAYYFKKQIIGLVGGLFILAFVSLVDYHLICRFVPILYVISVLLVAGTKYSPLGTDLDTGSFRWLNLKIINFQPSEITKIILILTLAVFYTKFKEKVNKFYIILIAGLIALMPTFFVYNQSDLSSSMVLMFIFAMMVFASGISYKIVTLVVAIGLPSVLILFWYIQQPFQKLLSSYQYNRVFGFRNPENEALGIMYQQNNSVRAIASGRVYGKMLLDNGPTTRGYNYVGVNESDFIFSIIGEEVGFIGCCFILGLLAVVIFKCLLTARKAKDITGQLIAVGVASMFMFQVFANIGVATRILPNTGLPLPFLSYGLSSMLGSMIGIGLILNIGIQTSKTRYDSIVIK